MSNLINEVHHISLLIRNEETLEFYKLLGFDEMLRKARANDIVVILSGYGLQLEMFIDNRHPSKAVGIEEPLGPRHFALKVDDLESEIERIEKLSVSRLNFDPLFGQIGMDWIGEKYVFFRDPSDGILELHE